MPKGLRPLIIELDDYSGNHAVSRYTSLIGSGFMGNTRVVFEEPHEIVVSKIKNNSRNASMGYLLLSLVKLLPIIEQIALRCDNQQATGSARSFSACSSSIHAVSQLRFLPAAQVYLQSF